MSRLSSALSAVAALALTAALATPLAAQVIGLKTVPLVAGDQFLIFPSENLGMGGASIAMDDGLADPFANPAKGAWSTESRVFSVPTFYRISNDNGGASTMPVGLHLRSESWFGGGLVALQDLDQGTGIFRWIPPLVDGDWSGIPSRNAIAQKSSTNRFGQFYLGREITEDWAIGASAMFVGVNGTDGVEQLFANAWDIEEFGSVRDYRVGLVGRLPGDRTVELSLVRNTVKLTHDVTSVTYELTDSVNWRFTPTITEEEHRNISKTWGARLAYTQPLDAPGWRVGGAVTVNRKDHPKIPTYDLTAVEIAERPPIPRDPGNSWAYRFGAGLSYSEGPTTFAIDIAYEPAVSDTWADELVDVMAADSTIIPAGGHTVDNHFDFSNASASVGINHEFKDDWAFQLGVRMRSYSYRMEQEDHVLGLDRRLTQQWTEWTPTWGLSYDFNGLQLRYVGLATAAGHFPFPDFGGVDDDVFWGAEADQSLAGDILAPPGGRLATPDETTVTHRIQISLPIR